MFRRADGGWADRALTDESFRDTGEGAVATRLASKPRAIKTVRQGRRAIVAVRDFQSTELRTYMPLNVPSARGVIIASHVLKNETKTNY